MKLDQCCSNHTLCCVATGDFLPTRVLDTAGLPADIVRLVGGHDASSRRYATLSHCWGKAQISRLLADNQTELERGIAIHTLPATFRQAIQVARFLDIRYLWIDSLCIIQDSAADWEVESAAMAKVYGYAHVNIAAASSLDSGGGLFFDRDPRNILPFAAYAPGSQDKLVEGWYIWRDDGRWGKVGQEPLHQRGWVLQERLLSARTIHFTKSQIFWHCLEDLGCESIITCVPGERQTFPAMQIGDYTDIRVTSAEIQTRGWSSKRAAKLVRDWQRLIMQYTKCGLTKDEDKLIAIFGIVDHIERLTGDRCLLGLWRSHMPGCLLWLVNWGTTNPDGLSIAPGSARPRPEKWRAPSWTWASQNLPVEHLFYRDDAFCYSRPLAMAVARRQNGSALCGKLELQGPLVTVDVGLVQGEIAARWCEGTISSLQGQLPIQCHVQTVDVYDSSVPAKALLIMQDWAYYFILIVPVDASEAEPDAFRRVGILVVETEDEETVSGLLSRSRG